MDKILPPGSTSAELQAAIDTATSGDTIIISGDMPFTNIVTIPAVKDITIQSGTGNNWVLTQTNFGDNHFIVNGSLILNDITLEGEKTAGSIHVSESGSLTMNSGAVIQNCYSSFNGGGVDVNRGSVVMNSGSLIKGCISLNVGAGVSVIGGSFTMNGGSITDNWSSFGAGVYIRGCTGTINNGNISRNLAEGDGGGIYMDRCITTITMNNNIIEGNEAKRNGGGIYDWESTFSIENSTINANTAGDTGGGIFTIYSSFTVSDSFVNGNTASVYGGGIYDFDGSVTVNGCEVNGNTTDDSGGGLLFIYTDLAISDSTVSGNKASKLYGGGVYLFQSPTDIDNSEISANTAYEYGGGIINMTSDLTVSDSVISGNKTDTGHGGGIYLTDDGTLETIGTNSITNNSAPNGNGGGIYTEDTTYQNLTTGIDTVFNGNMAVAAYPPPDDATTLYPNIQFASTSITTHPLNNYDINYIGEEPLTYRVSYDANGGTGAYTSTGLPFAAIYTVLTLAATGISRPGYTFDGWNTQSDGGGTSYSPGDTITITDNVTLYAQWIDGPSFYTVTYGANGGSGSFEDSGRQFGDNYLILSPSQTGISRPGFTFTGWNTRPDGSGISFASGDVVTITGDVRLYAQWRQNPTPKPKKMCREPVIKCRKNIAGQKIWDDNDNIDGKRPDSVEILLLRNGEVYKRTLVNSENGWAFGFCCVPVMKNSSQQYDYRIDETDVPGYTKKIEGYNVINSLNP